MVKELECNGTYPILKLYYFFGISSTLLSVATLVGNAVLVWYYRPSYCKRYNTLVFGIGVADIGTALSCLLQVINICCIAQCDGEDLTFLYTTDNISTFQDTKFEEQITISSLLYEISITSSVGFTALLGLSWLVDTACSPATHSCVSTVFVVGYPTLWTVVKMHHLNTAKQDKSPPVEGFLWFLLPVCVPVVVSSVVLFYVKYRGRTFPRREVSSETITRVTLMMNFAYFFFILMNLVAKQDIQMLPQLHLALYFSTTRVLPLLNATKTLIFLAEERSFAKDLEVRIKNSRWKPCLCADGVYLDQ
ncbi:hypothetical protein ACHWQZ_G004990 [Mnemiopsis leidyi]